MDLYGVSIGVQEVLFYLIKVYGFKMGLGRVRTLLSVSCASRFVGDLAQMKGA